ncbi:hypothetical protein OKW98_15225 [Pseudomonas sp. KU26590]|uniref:hypothetical protein n=1 Tax=Pseudomonas sp. KU26590 TaxID=2991051 RepID=UPI00223D604B|nr:hypothetical protein [Pseudomonas sp. KU26590]UZJ57972.1 hypothetical protein OKW98_15225 [Pseudomonas sp. KU26590]
MNSYPVEMNRKVLTVRDRPFDVYQPSIRLGAQVDTRKRSGREFKNRMMMSFNTDQPVINLIDMTTFLTIHAFIAHCQEPPFDWRAGG